MRSRCASPASASGDLLPAAYGLAREIAANASAVSVAAIRRLMWSGLSAPSPKDLPPEVPDWPPTGP